MLRIKIIRTSVDVLLHLQISALYVPMIAVVRMPSHDEFATADNRILSNEQRAKLIRTSVDKLMHLLINALYVHMIAVVRMTLQPSVPHQMLRTIAIKHKLASENGGKDQGHGGTAKRSTTPLTRGVYPPPVRRAVRRTVALRARKIIVTN